MNSLMTAALLALLTAGSAWAGTLDAPKGNVVLTLKGHLATTNNGKTADFDMAMLEKLAGRSATMETPWTNGSTKFEGPLLRAILEAAGASGSKLVVKALNDYAAEVPYEDATKLDTMLATQMNGKPMSVRDKGPLFMIYPFDKDPNLYNEKYFSRSVWQIREIEVVE